MHPFVPTILAILGSLAHWQLGASAVVSRASDPCAAIAGQKWVAPKDVRACFTSFKVDPEIKANVRFTILKKFNFC